MRLNDAADVGTPNKLSLKNVEISNIFYALNSIVGLTPVHGIVAMEGCTFNRLLICGAIVKNYYREVDYPDLRAMPLSDD